MRGAGVSGRYQEWIGAVLDYGGRDGETLREEIVCYTGVLLGVRRRN